MKDELYLDVGASSKVYDFINDEIYNLQKQYFGNASAKFYYQATFAHDILAHARQSVAKHFETNDENVIFTSGATESNNMVIKGVWLKNLHNKAANYITTKLEHPSVLNCFKFIEQQGFNVTYLDVNKDGQVNQAQLQAALNENTKLVSIMQVNHDTGLIIDIKQAFETVKTYNEAILCHSDITKALTFIEHELDNYDACDVLTFSGHKINGLKGAGGFLSFDIKYLQTQLIPLMHGGEQEQNIRAGTQNIFAIHALALALDYNMKHYQRHHQIVLDIRQTIIDTLIGKYANQIEILNQTMSSCAHVLSIRFVGITNEILLNAMKEHISASSGSACSVAEPSHSLLALGYNIKQINETIRFSFDHLTTNIELIKEI